MQFSVLSIDCAPALFDQMGSQKPALGRALLVRPRPRLNPSPPSLSPSFLSSYLTTCTLRHIRAPQSSSRGSLVIISTVPSKSAPNRVRVDRILCDTSNGLFTPSAVRTHWRRKGLALLLAALLASLLGIPSPAPNSLNPNPNPNPRPHTHPANQPWNPKAQPPATGPSSTLFPTASRGPSASQTRPPPNDRPR